MSPTTHYISQPRTKALKVNENSLQLHTEALRVNNDSSNITVSYRTLDIINSLSYITISHRNVGYYSQHILDIIGQ